MKYTTTIEINLPRAKVVELFDNPDNMKLWQEGFISMEPISGTPGQIGAKSKLHYKMGKRDIEMVETVVARNMPDVISSTYESKGVWNLVENHFSASGPDKTKWSADIEFRMSGFMKIFALLMPGAFKKMSMKIAKDFKAFAEKAG